VSLGRSLMVYDECCLVLNRTPLFMFVKPLAVLLSNILVCFSVFWCCRSLRWNLSRKSEKGQKKRSFPATALEHTRSDRAQWARTQCPQSSAGLVSSRLMRLPLPALCSIAFPFVPWKFLERLFAFEPSLHDRPYTWLRSSAPLVIEHSSLTWQHLSFL
jgi:hypothetical protein